MSEELKKQIEEYLDSHWFKYKWKDEKEYLILAKCGISFKIPYIELEYAENIDLLIKAVVNIEPGYSIRWWEGDNLISFLGSDWND